MSTLEDYDPTTRLVTGAQIFELRNANDVSLSKWSLDLKFFLHSHETFRALIDSTGYRIMAVYGDYERNAFQPQTSSYMIWILASAGTDI